MFLSCLRLIAATGVIWAGETPATARISPKIRYSNSVHQWSRRYSSEFGNPSCPGHLTKRLQSPPLRLRGGTEHADAAPGESNCVHCAQPIRAVQSKADSSHIIEDHFAVNPATSSLSSTVTAALSTDEDEDAADGSWQELWRAFAGAASAVVVRLGRVATGAGKPPPPPPPAPLLSEKERQALVCKWGPLFEQASRPLSFLSHVYAHPRIDFAFARATCSN
jgi:hypothetical protein